MLVLRVFSPVCDLSADRELAGVPVQEEPPGLQGQVCCCSHAAISHSPAGTALGTVLKKLHPKGIQKTLSQCLLSWRQFVGTLGDSKASKSKLHSTGGLVTWVGRECYKHKSLTIRETLLSASVKVRTECTHKTAVGLRVALLAV